MTQLSKKCLKRLVKLFERIKMNLETLNVLYVLKNFFFHHTACESTCDTPTSSAANQGDNTVSVAQGGTATSTSLSYQN